MQGYITLILGISHMNSLKISNLIELKALFKLDIYPIQREGFV